MLKLDNPGIFDGDKSLTHYLKRVQKFTFYNYAYDAYCSCQTVVRRNYEEQNFFEGSHTPLPTYIL